MNDQQTSVTVKILGQDFKVKCPPDKIVELQESALLLDQKMAEIRDSGAVLGVDRIAVIAALNIAHEMLILKKQKNAYIDTLSRRILDLQTKIEHALATEAA